MRRRERDGCRLRRAVSPEGLKLIPNTNVDALYLREGVNFSGYDKFTAVGKGVPILRPSVLNLDVAAPQTMNSGSDTLTFNAGQATLVLEVFDSVSSRLLARIIDTEVSAQSSIMISRNSMSNRADANALLKSWADRFGTAWQNARATAKNPVAPKSWFDCLRAMRRRKARCF